MKTVILCGGKGLRLSDSPNYICKPLANVGGMPILWHIMKIYMHYGINDFILCLGYNGEAIKDFFMNLDWRYGNFKLTVRDCSTSIQLIDKPEDFNITFIDTGQDTATGGRLKRIRDYIDEDEFMMTYGDGLSDIDLSRLLNFHHEKGKIATVTGIRNRSSYGIFDVDKGIAYDFREKPMLEGWINGGFFVLKKEVFDYIDNDETVFEEQPIKNLVRDRQLAVYQHDGYWQAIDTLKDLQTINQQWADNNRQWVKW